MNERQKKKLFKKNLIRIKKLHLTDGDIVVLQPDLEWIDAEAINEFCKMCNEEHAFGTNNVVVSPYNINVISNQMELNNMNKWNVYTHIIPENWDDEEVALGCIERRTRSGYEIIYKIVYFIENNWDISEGSKLQTDKLLAYYRFTPYMCEK